MYDGLTDVAGLQVGHWTDLEGATGCTVVLCPLGAVAGVDVRGSAPGTRETDLLRPGNLVQEVHAVVLAGGSAFGLAAADGVMRYLEERGYGFPVRGCRVPIVPAAILFDLSLGSATARPGPEAGYQACLAASEGPVAQGSVGAGTGATVGKALGPGQATKGGLGTASLAVGEQVVAALAAVNCFGGVVDAETGRTLAGPRRAEGGGFLDTLEVLRTHPSPPLPVNTTLGVVATDALLTKEQANKLAQMAQAGLAQAIRPAHTMVDGDVVFALATGRKPGPVDMTALGAMAAQALARAIARGITQARGLHGVPAASEWGRWRGPGAQGPAD